MLEALAFWGSVASPAEAGCWGGGAHTVSYVEASAKLGQVD